MRKPTIENGVRLVVAFCCVLLFSNCSKNIDSGQISSRFRFIHASPNAGKIAFVLNDKAAFAPELSYNDTTSYRTYPGGTYNVQVTVAGKPSVNTVINFSPANAYSMFAIDSANRVQLSVVSDDLTPTTIPLRVKLRFFNLMPNSTSLSLQGIINGDTTLLFGSRRFNQVANEFGIAAYNEFLSGNYKLLLYSGGTLLASFETILTPYKNFTVYAKGFERGIGSQAPALAIIQNN